MGQKVNPTGLRLGINKMAVLGAFAIPSGDGGLPPPR